MNLFSVLVGAACLTAYAQASSLSTTVANAISTSNLNLATAIQQVNSTINTADQTALASWNQLGQTLENLYTTYYDSFENYTTIDLSVFTTAISNIQNTFSSAPTTIQGDSISNLFSAVQSSADQVAEILTDAAANISSVCASSCTTKATTCTTKYGAKLAVDPITVDRVTACITAEQTRYGNIGSNISTLYNNISTNAVNYFAVVDVCDTPSADVLNNKTASYTPTISCLSNYLSSVNNFQLYTSYVDNIRSTQTDLVAFRVQRCASLVELDIQDRVTTVLSNFYNCVG
ncbi:uncharacterized protein LOC134208922 [Armigeres subalbatus]|uniref:uncharacterized protein LOC134208922 n=1 Tax=Armigeres subalbatus TaxID=124917 RepID=UPI002ED69AA1